MPPKKDPKNRSKKTKHAVSHVEDPVTEDRRDEETEIRSIEEFSEDPPNEEPEPQTKDGIKDRDSENPGEVEDQNSVIEEPKKLDPMDWSKVQVLPWPPNRDFDTIEKVGARVEKLLKEVEPVVFPESIDSSAYAQSFSPILWSWIIDAGIKAVRLASPADGHCFFHCICNAYYSRYQSYTSYKDRYDCVIKLRESLSSRLDQYYDVINGGNMREFVKESGENLSLESMKQTLESSDMVGFGFLDFVGMVLEKDIYILSGDESDVYQTHEYDYSIKGDRNSIVLYHTKNPGHFELVALCIGDKGHTHFLPTNNFVELIKNRVKTNE